MEREELEYEVRHSHSLGTKLGKAETFHKTSVLHWEGDQVQSNYLGGTRTLLLLKGLCVIVSINMVE